MQKKNIIFLSVSLILIILLGIGVSYSMWNISVSQDTNNTAYTECFDLSITNKENNISLNNAYPLSNDKGRNLVPYTFTVTNTCDITAKYSINLEILKDSTLSSNFIDLMINNSSIRLLKQFSEVSKVNATSIESRKISYGYLKSGESVDYSLRLWIDYDTTMEDLNNETKIFKSKIVVVGEPIKDENLITNNFDYTGTEQVFTAKTTGYYKLETWGAEGGYGITQELHSQGGYGGYSEGKVYLKAGEKLYINVGQGGVNGNEEYTNISEVKALRESYNGGGSGSVNVNCNWGGGGGATHIAKISGLLSDLESSRDNILIVSGGGGGGGICTNQSLVNEYQNGASSGGFIGNTVNGSCANRAPTGGTQTSGGIDHDNNVNGYFGHGGNGNGSGGGGGFYGGSHGWNCGSGAGGGSSYIGNQLLANKVMYCYNCQESAEENTKTISTTCSEETPTENCTKKGNGYARITLISVDENEENSIKSTIMSLLDTTGKCPVANADGNVTVTSIESTSSLLCSTQDNYGTSYYYRGNVMNNYVKFANFYWRIVRINGDGSIRLVYDGTSAHANGEASEDRVIGKSAYNEKIDDNSYVGYMYGTPVSSTYNETHANINDSTVKKYIDTWYENNLKDTKYEKYVVDNNFCNDRSIDASQANYENTGIGTASTAYKKFYAKVDESEKYREVTVKCSNHNDSFSVRASSSNNGALTYSIGLLSTDETMLAGGYIGNNQNFYLNSGIDYWTMSPRDLLASQVNINYVNSSGNAGIAKDKSGPSSKLFGVKPVINVQEYSFIGGTGSIDNPYILE